MATDPTRDARVSHGFRELDDLVLELKGLVLVQDLRQRRGAGADELAMYGVEIDRVRDRLARVARASA
jgi:hypothetical protein